MRLNSKESITTNVFWRLLERFGAQGVTFIVSIVLARLLDPGVYGVIALVTVFTSIMQVFVDSGLGNALIQKKNVDDIDFSSVFYFNLVFCLFLYGLMFVIAPAIASFYEMPDLVLILRVLSLIIIISGVKNVQQAYVARNMLFKKFFFSTLGGTIGAAVIGIFLAYKGFGVWALVAQYLFNATVDTGILWLTVKWRPKKIFSFQRLKVLFSFGWKLLVSKLIDTLYEDIRSLIIGKMYSASDLAYYNRGKQFPQLLVGNVNSALESVLFSSMSMEQDNMSRIRNMTSRSIQVTSYIVMPLMVGVAVCAGPIVNIVLTEKWVPCVPYMRVFCFGLALVPISIANLNAIKAIGRSDLYLKLEIIRKLFNIVSLMLLMWYGVIAIAFSYLLNCLMNLVINSMPNKRLLGYGYKDQIIDLAPAVLLSAFMGVITYSITFIGLNDWLTLLIQIPLGIIIYIFASIIFKIDSFDYILSILRNILHLEKKR